MATYVHFAGLDEVLKIDGQNESDVVRQVQQAISEGKPITFGIPDGPVMRHRIVNPAQLAWVDVTTDEPANGAIVISYIAAGLQIF